MHFAITERSLTPEGDLYALVAYWNTQADMYNGQAPVRVNDFVMAGVSATEQQIVRDRDGLYKLIGGTFIAKISEFAHRDEFEWETVPRDLMGELVEAINAHWELAEREGFVSERDDQKIQRSSTDVRGILAAFDASPIK